MEGAGDDGRIYNILNAIVNGRFGFSHGSRVGPFQKIVSQTVISVLGFD